MRFQGEIINYGDSIDQPSSGCKPITIYNNYLFNCMIVPSNNRTSLIFSHSLQLIFSLLSPFMFWLLFFIFSLDFLALFIICFFVTLTLFSLSLLLFCFTFLFVFTYLSVNLVLSLTFCLWGSTQAPQDTPLCLC